MLDRWLASLSRNTLAILAILVGIFLVVLLNPPHSVCDSQETIFRENVGRTFFIDPKQAKLVKKSRFELSLEACRFDGKPGSCYEFFESLTRLSREMSIVTSECVGKVAAIPQIRKALWDGVETLVQLAWGEKGPENFMDKKGWLSEADVALFCSLHRQILRAEWEPQWSAFREKQFSILPGAGQLSRNDAWSRMLFSVKCETYY